MFDTLAYLPSPGYAPGISTTYGTPPVWISYAEAGELVDSQEHASR